MDTVPVQDFHYQGQYRVQSRRTFRESSLEGSWIPAEGPLDLDERIVNQWLNNDPRHRGRMWVSLRPAQVTRATGDFLSEPDILYKKTNFTPAPRTSAMEANVVDVFKAVSKWRERRHLTQQLVGCEQYSAIESCFTDELARTVANEYFVHEAGHALGYDVESKTSDGYFRLGSSTVWPLVFVEEIRADLLAFGISADHLPPRAAGTVLLYNCLLRLGVHLEALRSGQRFPYGAVPFMLYSVLRDAGWLSPGSSRAPLRFTSLEPADLVEVMRHCCAHAAGELLDPELGSASGSDVAMVAAAYYRRRLTDSTVAELNGILSAA